jgi:radical SAM superfamily enzyme YgiQ (UPF0313 family)
LSGTESGSTMRRTAEEGGQWMRFDPHILMVFPRFPARTFWSLRAACDFFGARCPAPPLGLITVAALLPREWRVRLTDRNAEELTAADLKWADLVMTGGMLSQRHDTLAVIALAHAHGRPVVVGGPDVTSSPEEYVAADFRVLGEAENLLDQFIAAWHAGARQGTFAGERSDVDVTKSPVPRFDLLNFKHYLNIGVQFSRGCPFNCEFCDIIELYGHVPRAKSNEQMLRELECLYSAGYRGHVDFVDDNLIGNKKALKRFLPVLREWQAARRYPFQFSTEASINLADDPQLLQMMRDANFFFVFIGIESPDSQTLVATQKKQNTRRDIAESVHRIYQAGMVVTAGFIVGFDTERRGVAEAMVGCIEATSIPACIVGLLTALPGTQLTRRLSREGRMLAADAPLCLGDAAGLNFVTLRPRGEVLADYAAVLESIYAPAAYFERVRVMGRALNLPRFHMFPLRGPIWGIRMLVAAVWQLGIRSAELRRHFWRTLIDIALHRIANLEAVVGMMILYTHLGPFARYLIGEVNRLLATAEPALPAASRSAHSAP